jgi:hypothetical protein
MTKRGGQLSCMLRSDAGVCLLWYRYASGRRALGYSRRLGYMRTSKLYGACRRPLRYTESVVLAASRAKRAHAPRQHPGCGPDSVQTENRSRANHAGSILRFIIIMVQQSRTCAVGAPGLPEPRGTGKKHEHPRPAGGGGGSKRCHASTCSTCWHAGLAAARTAADWR